MTSEINGKWIKFDKHNTKFWIFNKFEFDVEWTLKECIVKLKEYGIDFTGAVSWGDLVTYRIWIWDKYNKDKNLTKQGTWELNFASQNPASEMTGVWYSYPNSAEIMVRLRKFHRGWFRNEYNETEGESIQ